MQEFSKLPVFILSTYGHNGVDWLHSLLDGSDEIIVMPAFSYFRTLNVLNISKYNNYETIVEKLIKNLKYNPTYLVRRRKFLFNDEEFDNFGNYLIEYLNEKKEKNFERNFFFGIHYSYAKLKKININKIKAIISQEHVPFYLIRYKKIFSCNFIIMVRDPRAAIAGSIKAMSRVKADNILNAHDFNFIILYWLNARYNIKKIISKNSSNIKFMQNETMHLNLEDEMKKLCAWIGIKFSKKNLQETILGTPWLGESAYLPVNNENDLLSKVPINYYNSDEVIKRWRLQLDSKMINMIEIICMTEMKRFNYEPDFKPSLLRKIDAYFTYFSVFRKIRLQNDPFYWRFLQTCKERVIRLSTIISANVTQKLFKRL